MRLLTTLTTVAFAAAVLAGNASAQTLCAGSFDGGADITAATPLGPVAGCDRIWGDEADEAYIVIDGLLFVLDTQLTILPGVIVRQNPRETVFAPATPTVGTPGTLIVTRGAFLNAQGTAGSPIIITTAAVDNNGVGGVGPADGVPDDDDLNGEFDDWTGPADILWDNDPRNNPRSPCRNGEQATLLAGGLVLEGYAPRTSTPPPRASSARASARAFRFRALRLPPRPTAATSPTTAPASSRTSACATPVTRSPRPTS